MASHWIFPATAFLMGSLSLGCSENNISKTGGVEEEETEPTPEPPFSTDWGQWLSMGTYEGKPAMTFYDRSQGGLGFAIGTITDSEVEWAFEGVDGYPDASGLDLGDRGTYGSMAIDSHGMIWATYYDKGAKNLRYAKRHPSLHAWKAGIADVGEGSAQDAGWFSSLAIASDGTPVVAHHDAGVGTLRVARWNGTGFVGGVFDRGEAFVADTGTEDEDQDANVGQFVKLKVVDGIEYMAYYDAANGDLKFAIGSDIHIVDSDGDVGKWPDFDVRGGQVHIVYQDATKRQLKYAKGNPGSWEFTVVDVAPYTGADTALYFDGDSPGVIYFEGRSNDMKQATLSGESWSTATIATEGAVGFHNEVITIDSKRYVGCYDYTRRSVRFEPLD